MFFMAFLSPDFYLVLYWRIVWLKTPILTSIDFISAMILINDSLILTTGELSVILPECSLVLAYVPKQLLEFAIIFMIPLCNYRSSL